MLLTSRYLSFRNLKKYEFQIWSYDMDSGFLKKNKVKQFMKFYVMQI